MKFGVDFHDTISWVYPVKAVQIAQDIPDWRIRLRDWYAQRLIIDGLPGKSAYRKAEEHVSTLPAIPPSLTDRFYGSQIIGEENYDNMTRFIHGSPVLDAPLKPGVKEGLERLALVDGHEPHLVTIVREEHFPYVSKYLEKQRISGLFASHHRLPREREGGEESKVGYCLENGIYALVDDELRRLKVPDHFAENVRKEFLGVMVGAGVSAEDAQRLEVDTEFINLLGSGGINPHEFLKMLVEIGATRSSQYGLMNGNKTASNGGQQIVYASRFDPYVRDAIRNHAKSITNR